MSLMGRKSSAKHNN